MGENGGWIEEMGAVLEGSVNLKSVKFPEVRLSVEMVGLVAKGLGVWRGIEGLAMAVPLLKHKVNSPFLPFDFWL